MNERTTAGHAHEAIGPVGDEAAKLLDAARIWARRAFGAATDVDADFDSGVGTDADDNPADCRWCPLCTLAAVLRGDRPETAAKIAAAASTLVDALRTLLDSPTFSGATEPEEASTDSPPAGKSAPAGNAARRVHRINLEDSPVDRVDASTV
jgi:hypothetical protein